MANGDELSPQEYEGGPSEQVDGAPQEALEELGIAELMAFEPAPERPDWMKTRFPVSMTQYRKLTKEAATPDEDSLAAVAEDEGADEDIAALEVTEDDAPEGEELAPALPEALAPPNVANFDGIPQTGFRPPDCTMAVGPNDVMVAVNTDLAVYSKTGQLRFRWARMTTLFRRVLPSGAGLFDPVIAYDHYAGRWIVVVAARRASPAGSWLMVGVSQTSNPGGPYWVWALDARRDGSTTTSNWADFPMLGFDTQGIYITTNQFKINGGFQYVKVRILDKRELYQGGNGSSHWIRWYDYWNLKNPDGSQAFTVQPAKHFRGTGGNPPAWMANAIWPSSNRLTVWRLNNPVGFWRGTSASWKRYSIGCRSYDLPPNAAQQGTTTPIETNDSRLLQAVYQHVGGRRSLWLTHTSKISWSGESSARSGVQWYEVDVDDLKVRQQNGYGARGKYYYFPTIQIDLEGNAYLCFGRSDAASFAELRQTGRLRNAPLHDLQNSRLIKGGESSYTGGRWGDYFGICRDPGTPRRVWMFGEYADAGGQWGTRVAAAQF